FSSCQTEDKFRCHRQYMVFLFIVCIIELKGLDFGILNHIINNLLLPWNKPAFADRNRVAERIDSNNINSIRCNKRIVKAFSFLAFARISTLINSFQKRLWSIGHIIFKILKERLGYV